MKLLFIPIAFAALLPLSLLSADVPTPNRESANDILRFPADANLVNMDEQDPVASDGHSETGF